MLKMLIMMLLQGNGRAIIVGESVITGAIYELDHNGRILLVAVIGHRREVYDE